MEANKIIILTENKRLFHSISNVIKNNNCEISNDMPLLADMTLIKTQLKITQNTTFLRTAFFDFIKKYSQPPILTLLDYKIETGLPKEIDPDNKKILRTFLLTLATYSKSEFFQNKHKLNLIMIGTSKDLRELEIYKSYPHFAFKNIKTSNQIVNSILEFYANNPEETKKIFNFDYIIVDESQDVIKPTNEFERILKNILETREKTEIAEKSKGQTPIMHGNFEPAKIIYKISDAKIYIDGNFYDISDKTQFNDYKENIVYIVGHYVNPTISEVNKKIEKFLKEDLPKIKKIGPNEKIIFSLNSHTIVDGSTSTALNTLFGFKFADYKNLAIITSKENYQKFLNSPGFISLKKYFLNIE
jgi:hypothetical protein